MLDLICIANKEVIGFSGNSTTTAPSIDDLIELVDSVPQLEIPVRHYFRPGEYWREITMPAGMTGVGHIHKHAHLCIVMSGHAIVTSGGETQEIRAPFIFVSQPGSQRAFHVFEDLRWITVHSNPEEIRDIVELECRIFDLPPEMVEAAIPVDEYRMTKRALCQG